MATLTEIAQIYELESGPLFSRWRAACLLRASLILDEDAGTTNHANRLIWAGEVLGGADLDTKAREMNRRGIATNATYQTKKDTATDSEIEYIVSEQVNTFATG